MVGGDDDDIEIVHGIEDDSDAYDSDIELVPTQATFKPEVTKVKASTKTKGTGETSEIAAIRDHHTEHIFWNLHEIAEEVSHKTRPWAGIESDASFEGCTNARDRI